MHVAADLCTQAVDDLVQGLGAGGVHADEELVLVLVHPRWTGLDVRQVDALLLWFTETIKRRHLGEIELSCCVLSFLVSIYILCNLSQANK